LKVTVRDNDIAQALRVLKRKMQSEGILREIRKREHYLKPSEKRQQEQREAVKREHKRQKKRLERLGF
jgi:small subunit ribosomal protein S21